MESSRRPARRSETRTDGSARGWPGSVSGLSGSDLGQEGQERQDGQEGTYFLPVLFFFTLCLPFLPLPPLPPLLPCRIHECPTVRLARRAPRRAKSSSSDS